MLAAYSDANLRAYWMETPTHVWIQKALDTPSKEDLTALLKRTVAASCPESRYWPSSPASMRQSACHSRKYVGTFSLASVTGRSVRRTVAPGA